MTTPLTREERERLVQRLREHPTPIETHHNAMPDPNRCDLCAAADTIDSLEERVKALDQAFSSASDSADKWSARCALLEKVVEAARALRFTEQNEDYPMGLTELRQQELDAALAALDQKGEQK